MARSLYFAYGSNMSLRQFRRRCPGAAPLGRARLPDYRLAFTRYSTNRKGGVADVIPAPGEEVWGALYDVDDACIAALDDYEGVPRSYRRETVVVRDESETPRGAEIYFANQTGHFAPSRHYLAIIVEGARDHGLPEPYIAGLERTRTYA